MHRGVRRRQDPDSNADVRLESSTSFGHQLNVALMRLVELELFTLHESQSIATKSHSLSYIGLTLDRHGVKDARPLRYCLKWIEYLIRVQILVHLRIEKSQDPKVGAAKLFLWRTWRHLLCYAFVLLLRKYGDDLRAHLTYLDWAFKAGATGLANNHLEELLKKNTGSTQLWLFAIQREREMGDFPAALTLAQKAYSLNKDSRELEQTLKNLALSIAIASEISTRIEEHETASSTLGNTLSLTSGF